ncbi:sulfatase [Paraurantiacibacter namhicola]|uniref:Arylsulfatase n=1 Tax=Paraurantiacibacter namhicola TaxID=645517 RepID=A0A1C7D6W8_9SPHN|nr:sulfatase [Paraurantiacibacter namhicola]ANU07224.1 Arylsulfatase [Paraurantiacibacter namhicola]
MRLPNFKFSALAAAVTVALAACAAGSANDFTSSKAANASSMPNIVVVLVDDMGWMDVGYNGSKLYETPAIDGLAADGLQFNRGYVAFPRCVPSRYALMTGRNPARASMPGERRGDQLRPEEVTIAEGMKQAGYDTFFAGKWHLGKKKGAMPEDQGFDINIGGGSAGAVGSHFYPWGAEKKLTLGPGLEDGVKGEYIADRLTQETVEFIEEQQATGNGRPFFAVLSHYAVHTPIQGKKDDTAYYARKIEANGGVRQPEVAQIDGQTKLHQDNDEYAAMVKSMDESVASVLATLDRLGIADNTIVVFTSDHGGLSNRGEGRGRELATSNLPLRAGKGHLWEGGVRVPFLIRWPARIAPGQKTDALVSVMDLFPTFLDAAGAPLMPEAHVDGRDITPLFANPAMEWPRTLHWYDPRPRPQSTGDTAASAIMDGDWKFVISYDESAEGGLFNVVTDPGETRNVAAQNPERAARMEQSLNGWLKSIDATKPRLGRKKR